MAETTINSFVVRFVQELTLESNQETEPWHGIIRHVQSSSEARFTDIDDAIAFMNCYLDITTGHGKEKGPGRT